MTSAAAEEVMAHVDDLRTAREIVGEIFDFDEANLGDEEGSDGW